MALRRGMGPATGSMDKTVSTFGHQARPSPGWLISHGRRRDRMPDIAESPELRGLRFACLPGCGFCCTFQPEVSGAEAAALRARVTPLALAAGQEGRTY